jgi:hypothetical protein
VKLPTSIPALGLEADLRLDRALRIAHEHALKVLEMAKPWTAADLARALRVPAAG